MTRFENVRLRSEDQPRSQRRATRTSKKVHDLLGLVQLDWLADRFPSQLSGGQRIRSWHAPGSGAQSAAARRPFGTRRQVRKNCAAGCAACDDLNVTSIFVTHDQEEA
jgi:sulfate transport system ATP-binding protein